MSSMGLDLGTSFVKCVSDNGQITFPSIYSYANRQKWDEEKTMLSGVGDDAPKIAAYPDAAIIRPIIEGKPIHKKGIEELLREIKRKLENMSPTENSKINTIVAGLPYDADDRKKFLTDVITNVLAPETCIIVPQAIGTIESIGKRGATVMDIGQGTTELVAIEDMHVLTGQSLMQGCDFITRDLGEFAFLDKSLYETYGDKIKSRVEMLADVLSNKLETFMSSLKPMFDCSNKVILSGGGSLIPGLKDAIIERIGAKIEVPVDPIMANAVGLYKIAVRHGVV